MWNRFRKDPLALIIGALLAFALVANVGIMIGKRKPATRVLGKTLISPTPAPVQTGPFVIPTFATAPEPSPTESESPVEPSPEASPAGTACLNSTDPSCGRFYWSPSPGPNRSMKIDVSVSSVEPRPGEVVTFVVTVSDPDAKIASLTTGYGDPSGPKVVACTSPARYGPWRTPARQAGKLTQTFTHAYTKAGTYVAKFHATSGSVCGSPYASVITIDVPIKVTAAPPPSPEPSPSATPAP